MVILFQFLLSALLISDVEAHEFHVSKLIVNHNSSAMTFEITFETFIDDLEAAMPTVHAKAGLAEISTEQLNLSTPKEHPSADLLLQTYLLDKIQLKMSSGESIPLTYLGKESAKDPYGIYVYFSIPAKGISLSSMTIQSSFLCELYEDQQNIIVRKMDRDVVDTDLLTCSSRQSIYSE